MKNPGAAYIFLYFLDRKMIDVRKQLPQGSWHTVREQIAEHYLIPCNFSHFYLCSLSCRMVLKDPLFSKEIIPPLAENIGKA